MSILINKNTNVLVQGITGSQGSFHTKLMLDYGTKIVAGVTPGKGGAEVEGVPVYNKINEALEKHEVDWSIMFVPAPFAKGAALEAMDNGLNLVIITEHVPFLDSVYLIQYANEKGLSVIGPNCPGIVTAEESKLAIIPGEIFKKGNIGVVARSGTLTYEIVALLTEAGFGQSTVVGIGGDPIIGIDFIKALELFENDPETEKIVLVGEIGGDAEEEAAEFIQSNIKKPVVSYITGHTAPKGKTMGHAGAIISASSGTAESKTRALEKAGVPVAKVPSGILEYL